MRAPLPALASPKSCRRLRERRLPARKAVLTELWQQRRPAMCLVPRLNGSPRQASHWPPAPAKQAQHKGEHAAASRYTFPGQITRSGRADLLRCRLARSAAVIFYARGLARNGCLLERRGHCGRRCGLGRETGRFDRACAIGRLSGHGRAGLTVVFTQPIFGQQQSDGHVRQAAVEDSAVCTAAISQCRRYVSSRGACRCASVHLLQPCICARRCSGRQSVRGRSQRGVSYTAILWHDLRNVGCTQSGLQWSRSHWLGEDTSRQGQKGEGYGARRTSICAAGHGSCWREHTCFRMPRMSCRDDRRCHTDAARASAAASSSRTGDTKAVVLPRCA